MTPKFFRCNHCKNIIHMVEDRGGTVVCCGEAMQELKANTSDGASEKHVPVVTVEGNKVKVVVGSVAHPMLEEHHIAWIYLETTQGGQLKYLDHTGAPEAEFALTDDEKVVAAYEYCNLHGLWKYEA
ncbi:MULTISPECIES: desulfoferrodoxin family protein [Anaerotignum]|uniref:desulfoferrodoxin family protein n=1 Tax=Anaerotignum TaxID=2039240 RepID=UPI002108F4F9|nr:MULTISPECIES: desulfoferrodoxin family protein [Anaerotignum]MCQ4935414.1 desulfoferrodoxin family protein [Anaerotignum propionicum]